MILTQRQLETMHNGNGRIVLPYRARLSPLAQDWIKKKRIEIGYADIETNITPKVGATSRLPAQPPTQASHFAWWCDGPCGPAKAAITNLARESNLSELQIPQETKATASAIKKLSEQVHSNQIDGGILLVKTGAVAMVLANRCTNLRAVLGTCLDSLEQGLQQIAANVLVLEHPYVTLMQARNLVTRFVKAKRRLPDDVNALIAQVANCGCKGEHK